MRERRFSQWRERIKLLSEILGDAEWSKGRTRLWKWDSERLEKMGGRRGRNKRNVERLCISEELGIQDSLSLEYVSHVRRFQEIEDRLGWTSTTDIGMVRRRTFLRKCTFKGEFYIQTRELDE